MNLRTSYLIPRILIFLLLLCSPVLADLKFFAHPEVPQGRSFIIYIASTEAFTEAKAVFDGRSVPFYKQGFGLKTIIGTEPDRELGQYPVRIEAKTADGKVESNEFPIVVNSRLYPKTSFYLKPARKKLMARDLVSEEWADIEPLITSYTPEKLWSGQFRRPVPGIITMAFGTREYVNNKRRGPHRGVDFRAKIGTPVKAPERGQLVYTKYLKAFGGTAIVNHGQGIFTLYFHLSKFLYPIGTFLRPGQPFALTGNSGISSGPHLHWGISVHNVRSDPLQWVETVMP